MHYAVHVADHARTSDADQGVHRLGNEQLGCDSRGCNHGGRGVHHAPKRSSEQDVEISVYASKVSEYQQPQQI
eukprot:4406256-Prymnesium_polylepis.2